MSKKNNASGRKSTGLGQTLRRTFLGGLFGGTKEYTIENERYDSPSKLAVKRFFRKPLATGAVIVLACMFIFVFVGPLFDPVDLSYTEVFHKNVAPNMSMMKVPAAMKDNTVSISSRGSFTLGLDGDGNVHVWGYYYSMSKDPKRDVMKIPQEVQDANIKFAAAGTDHCIAIGDDGTIYGWGEYDNGQYGLGGRMTDICKYKQPSQMHEATNYVNTYIVNYCICNGGLCNEI